LGITIKHAVYPQDSLKFSSPASPAVNKIKTPPPDFHPATAG